MQDGTTLIAQITDVHIGFDPHDPEEYNMQRLRMVLERLVSGPNRPDLLLMTGDLTEAGSAESYTRLRDAIGELPFPVFPMTGNHDARAALQAAFPDTPQADGFVQYALELDGLRVLVLDTLEEGRHGGGFCERRAAWLAAELEAYPATPTLIALHHPPFASGIAWLDADPREVWTARLGAVLAGRGQVIGLICGHLHRTIQSQWLGIPVRVCASVAPPVALDLNPIDPAAPDGREMISDELPGYALHRWDGTTLVSHCESVSEHRIFARYDAGLQKVVSSIAAERREG